MRMVLEDSVGMLIRWAQPAHAEATISIGSDDVAQVIKGNGQPRAQRPLSTVDADPWHGSGQASPL
jgi:hypothetical protein